MSGSIFATVFSKRLALGMKDGSRLRRWPPRLKDESGVPGAISIRFDITPQSATFHLFQKLPQELQNTIWKIAAKYSCTNRIILPWPQPVPALLHVCKTARKFALEHLTLLELDRTTYNPPCGSEEHLWDPKFQDPYNSDPKAGDVNPSSYFVYVSPPTDSIFLSVMDGAYPIGWGLIDDLCRGRIEHVIMDLSYIEHMADMLFEYPDFSTLKTLKIVSNAENHAFVQEYDDPFRQISWDMGVRKISREEITMSKAPHKLALSLLDHHTNAINAARQNNGYELAGRGMVLLGEIYNKNWTMERLHPVSMVSQEIREIIEDIRTSQKNNTEERSTKYLGMDINEQEKSI